jgi:cyclophilin family peptidyl-prolyl cis-trans isomerase
VRYSWRLAVTLLLAIPLLALPGCKRGSPSVPASVNGPGGEQAQTAGAAKSDQDPLHPVVAIETSLGTFTIRLDKEKAPLTVDNFLGYVASHHYDDTIFHQVLKDYPRVALGGAYRADLVEKKTRSAIRNEADNGLKNRRGTIAMARQPGNEDSATALFFVNLADNEVLDHKDRTPQGYGYCVFGAVVNGLETLERIGQVATHDVKKFERTPVETVAIKSIRRMK